MLARQWRRAESAHSTCLAQVVYVVVLPDIVVVWAGALDAIVVVSNKRWISAEIYMSVRKSAEMVVRNTNQLQ